MQHIPEEDLALYALQALTPEEMRVCRTHLDECSRCRQDLASVLGDVALIGMAAEPQPLPAGARDRFLNRIAAEPRPESGPVRSISNPPAPVVIQKTRLGAFGWLGWIAAAACLTVAILFGSANSRMGRELRQLEYQNAGYIAGLQHAQEIMDVLTAKHAVQVTLTEAKQPPRPVGHTTYMPEKGALIFVASNLHPLPENKTYELWLIPADGKAPLPAGLFRPDATGTASVVMPPLPKGVAAKAFGVTIEDLQGSETPTLPIVMSGQ
jgi:hypothetical protein